MSAKRRTKRRPNVGELLASLPSKIRIGPHDILIKIASDDLANEGQFWGRFYRNEQAIVLAPDSHHATPSLLAETFIHEIFHAVHAIYYMNLKSGEEQVVSHFAGGWTQIYLDNPWLSPWIAAALN